MSQVYNKRLQNVTRNLLPILCAFLEAVSRVSRTRLLRPIETRATRRMARAFRAQGAAIVRHLGAIKGQFPIQEVAPKVPNIDGPFDRAAKQTALPFAEAIDEVASAALEAGALATLKDLGMVAAFNLDNPRAVTYLKNYGAKLVTQINETTREYLKTVVTQGIEQGWSYGKIAAAITERYKEFAVGRPQQHIDSRAHLIAVQEAGQAYSEGTLIVGLDLEDIGIEMVKSQLTVGDERVSEDCRANAAQGWIPIRQEFQSGHQRPLIHVACRCALLTKAKGAME